LGLLSGIAVIAACGGGSSKDADQGPALELAPKAFQLSGTESSTVDLTKGDVVLAAALASLSAATNLRGIDFLGTDSGTPEPGAGRAPCQNGGEATETAEDDIGVRDVLFEASQCYGAVPTGELLVDGSIRIFKISSIGGAIEGSVEPGATGGVMARAVRPAGDARFNFTQSDALIDYEGDSDEDRSSTVGGRWLAGYADVNASSRVVFQKGFEIFAGTGGVAFESQTNRLSDTLNQISYEGPLVYRGEGMEPACNVTGAYAVSTNAAITLDYSGDGGRATAGSVSIASGEANASVEFQADGSAVVTTANGSIATYPFADVDSHCDLDS
jgi:hypothetical protein